MTEIVLLKTSDVSPFEQMTYPAYRNMLYHLDENFGLAIGAKLNGEAVGLAFGYCSTAASVATLSSLYTRREHRNQGIATRLLAAFEATLAQNGCKGIGCSYVPGKPTTAALEHLLLKSGWEPPSRAMSYKVDTGIMKLPSIHRLKFGPDFSVFPWHDLSAEERDEIQHRQRTKPWYPEMLSPFGNEDFMVPSTSLGLRYLGEVVGWIITEQAGRNTSYCRCLFVREDLQRSGKALILWAQSLKLHNWEQYPYVSGEVLLTNRHMVRLFERHFDPYLFSKGEVRRTYKKIGEMTGEERAALLSAGGRVDLAADKSNPSS